METQWTQRRSCFCLLGHNCLFRVATTVPAAQEANAFEPPGHRLLPVDRAARLAALRGHRGRRSNVACARRLAADTRNCRRRRGVPLPANPPPCQPSRLPPAGRTPTPRSPPAARNGRQAPGASPHLLQRRQGTVPVRAAVPAAHAACPSLPPQNATPPLSPFPRRGVCAGNYAEEILAADARGRPGYLLDRGGSFAASTTSREAYGDAAAKTGDALAAGAQRNDIFCEPARGAGAGGRGGNPVRSATCPVGSARWPGRPGGMPARRTQRRMCRRRRCAFPASLPPLRRQVREVRPLQGDGGGPQRLLGHHRSVRLRWAHRRAQGRARARRGWPGWAGCACCWGCGGQFRRWSVARTAALSHKCRTPAATRPCR